MCKSGLSSTEKFKSNETLLLDPRGLNAAFSRRIPSVSVVKFTIKMSKLNRLAKTDLKRIYSRTENFSHRFTTKKP